MTSLKLAVCLFHSVCALDYQGPMEMFGFLTPGTISGGYLFHSPPAYVIEPTYLADTLDPVTPVSGPTLNPGRTYDNVKADEQFDILLVPGGTGVRPEVMSQSLLGFLRKQAPGAKYVLSVCTGSWALAQAGVLDGKRATTNKLSFNIVKKETSHQSVTWVPKARWVVDGNFWTSSGVTAGADMANAFLEHLVGKEATAAIRSIVELGVRDQDDDEFAAIHGLVEA